LSQNNIMSVADRICGWFTANWQFCYDVFQVRRLENDWSI